MKTYLVGGAVRDQLLDYPVYDRDWVVVGATPEQMLKKGYRPVGKDFPVFIHPCSGEEYALARTERKSGKGYTGFHYHASPDVTLEQDLIRRDLTINAMAQDHNGNIIDPYNGQQDLKKRILRHVSPAFAEDPLRVLRVARFSARYAAYDFSIAPETLQLMRQLSNTDELEHLTAERVWQEFQRALGEPAPEQFLQTLQSCQALEKLFPELVNIVSDTSALELIKAEVSPAIRFAVLFYKTTEKLDIKESKQLICSFCKRQRVPNAFRDLTLQLRSSAHELNNFQQLSGEQRHSLISALDLLRRPEKLPDLLSASAILFSQPQRPAAQSSTAQLSTVQSATEQTLPQLLEHLLKIQPQELMQKGLKGKALGEEIKRRQVELCQRQAEGTL
ncbi:MAG: hypothetical protein V7731_21340 [Amphritea sp.]